MPEVNESDVKVLLGSINGKLDLLLNTMYAHIAEDHKIFYGDELNKGLLMEHNRLMNAFTWWRWIMGGAMTALLLAMGELLSTHIWWH